ncbi:MAG: cupin domain-containing protein [Desulfuromonadaceae bacterium]|nr:cupin domain-containing protein [Desulfuromonas sp.]MDY0185311.1 cupin domain-containing protein [Desulfuromonadaceae bacterium]
MANLFASIPAKIDEEVFEALLTRTNVRIERILSHGQSTPAQTWYDQDEHEWVVVLEGCGILEFEDGTEITLRKGDHLNIPAHEKHRVKWTDPDTVTIWLAVFYSA